MNNVGIINICKYTNVKMGILHTCVFIYTENVHMCKKNKFFLQIKQYIYIYSALQKYWNSKDKIALLAVESNHLQI